MHFFFILLAGWGSGPKPSGPGSGWGDHPTSRDSKASGNGEGHGGWDDGSGYKSSNNTGNTWSNNKPDRYDMFHRSTWLILCLRNVVKVGLFKVVLLITFVAFNGVYVFV